MTLKLAIKSFCREVCPPILWNGLSVGKRLLQGPAGSSRMLPTDVNGHHDRGAENVKATGEITPLITPAGCDHVDDCKIDQSMATNFSTAPQSQDLDIYWDPAFAEALEHWGEGNAWHEIVFLVANCRGKVLDIACGTGKTIELLSQFSHIDLYGFDISDFFIAKAVERGISAAKLKVTDATNVDYAVDEFEHGYSIGSLEHFTEEGIEKFISECHRVTSISSFHMVPVSRSGKNEGWMKRGQSYHNNSLDWWLEKFRGSYKNVFAIDSLWQDDISVGKWLVAIKGDL